MSVVDALAALLWLMFACGVVVLVLLVALVIAFLVDSAKDKR